MRTHTKTFHIRFTEKEYERLCKYALKTRLPKTTYIRHMINGCCPREVLPEFWEFKKYILAIGNNLNQLTRLAHRTGSLHIIKVDKLCDDFHELYRCMLELMIAPEDLNVQEVLERGRKLTESEYVEIKRGTKEKEEKEGNQDVWNIYRRKY